MGCHADDSTATFDVKKFIALLHELGVESLSRVRGMDDWEILDGGSDMFHTYASYTRTLHMSILMSKSVKKKLLTAPSSSWVPAFSRSLLFEPPLDPPSGFFFGPPGRSSTVRWCLPLRQGAGKDVSKDIQNTYSAYRNIPVERLRCLSNQVFVNIGREWTFLVLDLRASSLR